MDAATNLDVNGSATPLRVLIVEDSKLIRARLEEALSGLGNVVVLGWVETESDAHVTAKACPWDVLVLDLQLKQGNGLRFLKNFDAGVRAARGKIAVFTSHAEEHCRERAMAMGADYFFDNTRDFDLMLQVIAQLAASPVRASSEIDLPVG